MSENHSVMNSIQRLILGVTSSLLLACGFVRAADRLDPMNHSLRNSIGSGPMGSPPSCTVPCELVAEVT